MIYLVTGDCKSRYNLDTVEGSAINVIRTLVNSQLSDHIVVIDDYHALTDVLKYLNMDYRAVLNTQDIGNHPSVSYEEDPEKIVALQEFLKRKKEKPSSNIEEVLGADNATGETIFE